MPTVKTCAACGVRLTFEGAGPGACPKCGAPLGASAPAPRAPAPPPAPPAPPGAELVEEPRRARAAPSPPALADPALESFANGCARVRAGSTVEAIGITVAVAYFALLRFAPPGAAAIVSAFGSAGGLLLLLPVVPLAVGNLLTAFGRAHMLSAARAAGAGAVAGSVLVFACARFALTTVGLLYFGGLALALLTGAVAGPKDRAAQAAEDAQLASGGAALLFGYLLGLLLEGTALTALATVAAARNLRALARQVNWAAFAFQLLVVAGFVSFAVELLAPAPPRRNIFESRPVPLAEACAFLFQLAALGWYLNRQYAVHAAGSRAARAE
jgi:hypothetical protein